jgi:hypothetical protein
MRQITAIIIQKLINNQNIKKNSRRTYEGKLEAQEHHLVLNIKNKIEQNQLM